MAAYVEDPPETAATWAFEKDRSAGLYGEAAAALGWAQSLHRAGWRGVSYGACEADRVEGPGLGPCL